MLAAQWALILFNLPPPFTFKAISAVLDTLTLFLGHSWH
jgi:hypothetical protein